MSGCPAEHPTEPTADKQIINWYLNGKIVVSKVCRQVRALSVYHRKDDKTRIIFLSSEQHNVSEIAMHEVIINC